MLNREKVIKGLEICKPSKYSRTCGICPYREEMNCDYEVYNDALALLKEQEAVEPIPPTDESDLWKCGNCNHQLFRCTHQRYCEMCGRKVKWE